MDEKTAREISSAFDRIDETLDKMEKHIDDMSAIINENLNNGLEKNIDSIKVMTVKDSWKNTVIWRIMYFLLGYIIGFASHYLRYLL